MTKPKHTPGPWETVGDSVYQCESAPKGSYDGCEVAYQVSRHMAPEERRANAKLMAASPELFTALEDEVDSMRLFLIAVEKEPELFNALENAFGPMYLQAFRKSLALYKKILKKAVPS